MRLEGSLDAFGLPDILQLLAFTSKTGALRVRRTGGPGEAPGDGVVYVRGGAIAAASSDVTQEALARRIVAVGLVDDAALRAAVDRVRGDASAGLVRALLDAGGVSEDAACGLAREQVIDAVCELLRWTDGEFSFVVDEPARDALPVTLPVDEVVAEGRRRLGAWRALTALIPSPAAVLSLSLNPSVDPSCTREEWALLSLLDGHRTVGDLVSLLGRAEYAVVSALAALVERGLLVDAAADSGGGAGVGLTRLVRRQAMLLEIERPSGTDRETSPDAASRRVGPAQLGGPAAGPARTVTAPPDLVFTGHDAGNAGFADAGALPGRLGDVLRVDETPAAAPPGPVPVMSARTAAGPGGQAADAGHAPILPDAPPVSHQVPQRQPDFHQSDVRSENPLPGIAGSAALEAAPAGRPAIDGDAQDSVVTKSLLLRLIAGVRGL